MISDNYLIRSFFSHIYKRKSTFFCMFFILLYPIFSYNLILIWLEKSLAFSSSASCNAGTSRLPIISASLSNARSCSLYNSGMSFLSAYIIFMLFPPVIIKRSHSTPTMTPLSLLYILSFLLYFRFLFSFCS